MLTTVRNTPPDAPCFPEVGVLGLVPDDWDGNWQPRHQVLSRLSRYFNVVWVSPAQELWARSGHGGTPVPPPRESLGPNLTVYKAGKLLPRLYRPAFLASFLARLRLKKAKQLLSDRGCRKVILYLWRPEYAEAVDLINSELTCYHIDDEYSFSELEQPLSESEALLISRVDQVFIHSRALLEKKGDLNRHTRFVPNGVDYRAYATPVAEPEDLVTIPHPRIGYTGVLKRQLDWPLLFFLVQRHTELSFIFVGPQSSHPEVPDFIANLSKRRNVYFLGAKSVRDLAAYPQHFDVCVMPYQRNDYTKYIYPLKLHEYLASGRPVVGTGIRSLYDFADVIALANSPEQWSMAICNALGSEANAAEQRMKRQAVARKHDWEILVEEIAKTMVMRLGFSDSAVPQELHASTAL